MLQINLSPIKKIEAQVQSSNEYISLSQGTIKIGGVPKEIKQHLQKVLQTDITDYYQSAWGIMPLREKIAHTLSQKCNCHISHNNVLVTHGCAGALATLLLTLVDHGEEVILPEPTYPAYKNLVDLARGKAVFVNCIENGIFILDLEKIKRAKTDKTKVIIFSNPCNPCGTITHKKTLLELAEWCEVNKIYLVVDEAYDDYIFDDSFYSATALVPEFNYLIRAGSYSKSLSMSGWRVGFMIVPNRLTTIMGTSQDALLNCPNVPAQHAVLYALDHPKIIEPYQKTIRQNRDIAISMLQPLVKSGIISFQIPPASFYLFLKTQEANAFDLTFSILKHAKVGLIPGSAFGPNGKPYMRLCFARHPEILQEGIKRLLQYYKL